ncbi:MAG TPA: NADH-quinone oxidoreductase subunit C [Polyangiaceae bacterium]|nr:NADH-quinone oxidoreductase subunit C [Polyangiaceae bacterium]
MAKALVELVEKQFPGVVLEKHAQHGDETIVVDVAFWRDVAMFLRSSPAADMKMLTDLTAVDYPDRDPRFEVVAHFYSLAKGHRLRMKARVGASDGTNAKIASLADIWASANWMEREVWDMFGVVFDGHPDLRRILLYPEFVGHPLRRDYPADRIQPLVEYRAIPGIQKIAPFGADEGMSFGRQTHDARPPADGPDPEVFPEDAN